MKKQLPRKKWLTVTRWVLLVILVQLLLFNISSALYAHKFTSFYDDIPSVQGYGEENVFAKTWRLFSGTKIQRSTAFEHMPPFPVDTVTLKTDNGIYIDCWYTRADSAAKGTVILFHPLTANKGEVLTEASDFRFFGYNIFLVDFRGHGHSGGSTTTLGVREAEEVKLAYDHIRQRGEKKIILWGLSMGAVAVTKAVADYNLQPAAIIIEEPFESLQSHFRARARVSGFSGFPERPFGFFVTFWAGIERGFGGFRHKTTSYVKKIHCPVLLQWGALDAMVLKEETDRVFAAIASTNKRLVVYPTAAHQSLNEKDPLKWRIEVQKFLDETVR